MEKRESEHKSVPVGLNQLGEEEGRCEGRIEHLVAHVDLTIMSPFILQLFLYSNSKYKMK
jgi:hypothetical protein